MSKRTAVLFAFMLGGCRIATFGGENVEQSVLATAPYGAMGTVQIGDSTFRGELIGIRNDTLLIETVSELIEIPALSTRTMRFPPVGVGYGDARDLREFIDKLRLAARHPFGVPEPALQALLDKHKQSIPRRITR